MKYIGRHPQEGFPLVETNTPSGASVITQQNTFISKGDDTGTGGFGQSGMYHDMYLVEAVAMSSSGDSDSMKHKWIDNAGSDEDGTYYRAQFYNSPTGAISGTTVNNANTGSPYGANFNTGIGDQADDSASGLAWWTPFGYQKRTKHRFLGTNTNDYGNADGDYIHVDQSTILKDTSLAHGYEIAMHSGSTLTGTLRVYGVPKHHKFHGMWNLKQSNPLMSHVDDSYIGNIPSGQGWIKLASATASDGDTNLDFQQKFTAQYDTYKVIFRDCIPKGYGESAGLGGDLLVTLLDDASQDGAIGTYDMSRMYTESYGATGEGQATNTNGWPNIAYNVLDDSSARSHANGVVYILNPMSTSKNKKIIFDSTNVYSVDGSGNFNKSIYSRGAVGHETTSAMNGVRFYWEESGVIEWTGGKMDLYGWQNK